MTPFTKLLLGITATLGLLTCLICGGGALWLKQRAPELAEDARRMNEEASRYAQGRTKNECVAESIRRLQAEPGLSAEVRGRIFLTACLRSSLPDAGFCADVPSQAGVLQTATWSRQECEMHGAGPGLERCARLVQEIAGFCARETRPSGERERRAGTQ